MDQVISFFSFTVPSQSCASKTMQMSHKEIARNGPTKKLPGMAHFNIFFSFRVIVDRWVLLVTKFVSVFCFCSSGNMMLYVHVLVDGVWRVGACASRTESVHGWNL